MGLEIPYVLKRADGTIQVTLMMSPELAQKINYSRDKMGYFNGRWEPNPQGEPWSELKRISPRLNHIWEDN